MSFFGGHLVGVGWSWLELVYFLLPLYRVAAPTQVCYIISRAGENGIIMIEISIGSSLEVLYWIVGIAVIVFVISLTALARQLTKYVRYKFPIASGEEKSDSEQKVRIFVR